MADQDARQILRTALEGFDAMHLQKIVVAAYDRWNWDTGSEADKDWFEIAEELLKEHGVNVNVNINNNSTALNFTCNAGITVPILTMDAASQELTLGTTKTLQVTDASSASNRKHDLFEVSNNNNLELGYELKQALVEFMVKEISMGLTPNPSGQNNLKQAIESEINIKAVDAIRNRL